MDKVLVHQANAKMDEAILKRLLKMYGSRTARQRWHADDDRVAGQQLGRHAADAPRPDHRGNLDGHTFASGDLLVFAAVGAGMNVNALVYLCP